MRFFIGAAVLSFALASAAQQYQEAPTGFDNKSNGVADDMTHQADQVKFDEVEGLTDGLDRSITPNPAANAIRILLRVAPAKSPNCASGIWT